MSRRSNRKNLGFSFGTFDTLSQTMMPLYPTWPDIVVRLLLTMVAGALIGYNREAHGHAAGLRTTMLVALAASLAMIQANILLPIGGKTPDSFAVMDLMRLPLGILTGVGFIGGGAILKRGGSISGVTTAATLWIVTAIGLCFGGGQLGLGAIATALGIVTLWTMHWVDLHVPRERRANLVLVTTSDAPPIDLDRLIRPLGYRARFRQQSRTSNARGDDDIETRFEIRWRQAEVSDPSLDFLAVVGNGRSVKSFEILSEH
jgi:putative Mg2+ transporter-C (MgtC) family protein